MLVKYTKSLYVDSTKTDFLKRNTMTQPELSWAQQDPGMMLALQGDTLRPEEEILAPAGNRRFGKLVARGALALGLGVVGAGIYETYDSEPASAEAPCADNEYVAYWEDFNNDGIKQLGEVTCKPIPTTTTPTTRPPATTQPPSSGGGGGSGGGSGGGTPTTQPPRPTTTTSPFIEVNDDGDAWSVTVDKNTGEKVGGWDVNDDSPGLGEQGITQLQGEMSARGLDPATLTDAQKLTAMTVHPDAWGWYFADILSVPTTTTTTTTIAPETTTTQAEVIASTAAPTTEVQASSTVAEQPSTTQAQEAVAGGNDESDDDGSSSANVIRNGIIAGASIALSGLLIFGFARRRHKKEEPTPRGPYGGNPRPVPGS